MIDIQQYILFKNKLGDIDKNKESHMKVSTNWNRYCNERVNYTMQVKMVRLVLKKKLMRDQVLILPKCLVGIEACGGANY